MSAVRGTVDVAAAAIARLTRNALALVMLAALGARRAQVGGQAVIEGDVLDGQAVIVDGQMRVVPGAAVMVKGAGGPGAAPAAKPAEGSKPAEGASR